jgi:predicted nuclease of restriction endonuclease-like (RecB) superfamily
VPTLSKELQQEFPKMSGFSVGNLWLMAQFYNEYVNDQNLVPLVREISWSKHIVILKKCKDSQERQFYTLATKKYGWTKDLLIHQIENKTRLMICQMLIKHYCLPLSLSLKNYQIF